MQVRKTFKNVYGFLWLLAFVILPARGIAQQYKTLGPNSCGLGNSNCHVRENNWWKDDKHFSSAELFFNRDPKYVKVAGAYGISETNLARGNTGCMACHGTIMSGRESREVDSGVSCESCHGAGSGFLDVHDDKPDGYQKGLRLGMVENSDLNVRAKTCVRCHYITDQKLINAGHPTGADFEYVRKIKEVATHWKHPLESAGQLQPAFASAMRARGSVSKPPRPEQTPTPPTDTPVRVPGTSSAEAGTTVKAKKLAITKLSLPLPPDKQKFKTLGPSSCGTDQANCHVKEYQWLKDDDHFSSINPFYPPKGNYLTIAQKGGIGLADIAKGNQNCMQCHGTVISEKFDKEVDYGVSCESCHGPGSGYKDIHSKRGMRPASLDSGLVDNFVLTIMGDTCVRCHYITEQALLNFGHKPGWETNGEYLKGIRQRISKHWKDDRNARRNEDSLRVVFDLAISKKVPLPRIVEISPVLPPPIENDQPLPPIVVPPKPKLDPPALRRDMPVRYDGPVDLEPFPAVNDSSMSVPYILRILKKRLELLYQKTGGQ